MYNIGDDKELDRLSREAAGRYTPPGEANWQALSEELDRIMPVTEKKKRRFLFWWLLPLLLIGGGAAYWIGTHPSTTEAIHTTTASPSGSTSSEAIQESSPAISSKTPVETDQELLRKEPQPQKPGAAQNESTKPVNTQTETVSGLPKNKTLRTGKPNSRPDKMRNDRSSGIKELADNSPTIPASGNSTAVDKKADITLQLTQPVTEKTATPTTDQPQKKGAEQSQNNIAEKTATPATITESTKTPETTPAPVANTNNSSGKGFSYAFVAGVDKSTVKFVYGNDPGMNLGMMAGYHFSNRWSVHTGLIYTQKNYKVAGKDFTAPKGNWVSYYNLESITGYCRMWEVPLQVRYTMGKTENKSSFFSAGLSSYFMTKESYDYFYYYNNQPVTRNSTLDSDDQHVLSIAHFSVGFENKISKKWALQVEPYAKVPLGGVGFGSIRLSSFGLNFSLQHRQPAKK